MKKIDFVLVTTTIIILLCNISSYASDIINVQALNSRIIMLHFDDGFVRYHKRGESRQNEWVVSEPLDVMKAGNVNNYTIKSSNGFYGNQQKPVKVSRKSKGTEFTWLCQNWSQSVGCINSKPDHAKEHWIYLHLPEPLETGKKYNISTGDIAGNGKEWEFEFTLEKNRSEAIHVNIIGYDPRAPKKYGYVYHWGGETGGIDFSNYNGNNFYLINTKSGEKAFTGTVKFRKSKSNIETYQTNDTPNQNFLGADVYECDFSAFNSSGEYILAVDEIGSSFPFKVEKDIYRLPFYTSVRGLYHNRSGIDLEKPFTEYTRPAPHNPVKTPGFAGKLKYTTSRFIDWNDLDNSAADKPVIEAGILGPIDTWGWYQDAGDWDGYLWHMKIPATLMLTWEIAPEKFADGELNLPEGVNQIPDILDEARWLIRFFHRTRHEIMKKGYGTGGVGSRVAPDWFGHAPEGTPSNLDNGQWIISGEDPFTTYFYAGLAGHFALVLDKLGIEDPEGIDWKKEAEEAFIWAKNNAKPTDWDPAKVHNYILKDFELYAAASLFRLKGNPDYLQIVKNNLSTVISTTVLDEDKKWGTYALITGNEHQIDDAAFMSKIKGAIMATADQRFTSIGLRACRYGDNMWMPMVIGHGTTPRVFELMMGHFLSKSFVPSKTADYLAGIFTTADYFLGCNPLNMAWITHVGVRYPERVMHLDSWYSETGEIIPGITPYGPWRDDGANPATGPWDIHWPYKTLYPEGISKWPGHERWFNNYTTPLNAEFTVHQNTLLSAVVYGYLCDVPDGSFEPNKKPSIGIISPEHESGVSGDININISVSDPNGEDDIAWVEFYNEWHKIGQSNEPPYNFTWKKPPYGTAQLSAKVIDKSGFSNKSETIQITTIPLDYKVSVVVTDSITGLPVATCEVKIQDSTKITTAEGLATFEKVTGLMNILLQKKGYKSKNLNQISIYSDTTLYFTLTPIKKSITIVLRDDYSGSFITSAFVNFNSVSKTTGVNGDVTFSEYDGTYAYSLTKTNYFTGEGELKIASDTILNLLMTRSQAEIKFVLQQGAVPVSNAKVAVLTDTATTSNLGIARIRNLNVPSNFEYHIYKSGFRDVMGSVYLRTDTTLNIQMEMIPVNASGFEKTENLRIWPNPVDEVLFLSSSESIAGYSVYNLAGSKIKVESSAVNGIIQLDFSRVIAGIYFIEISFVNHRNVTRKIIRK
jgi:endoglucanase